MSFKVTHCGGHVSANTRPHQLRWVDREMGTAILCTECSQVTGLIQKLVKRDSVSWCSCLMQLFCKTYCVCHHLL